MAMDAQPMPVAMLVDLVNGWGTVPRAMADARDRPPIAWLVDRHGVAAEVASELGDQGLDRIADLLYPVFAATAAAERAALVTDLLTRCKVRPALGSAGGRVESRWLVERDAVLAAAALTLRAQLVEHDPERLGTCADTQCGDAYVDTSPGGHRRFCSVRCQNRSRVSAFRRRRSAERRR